MTGISIIVPTLNEERYLPRLLDSIYGQDYEGEYEIIVVDGRSLDSTKQVCKSYEEKLPVSFHLCDAGVSKQRNYGATLAEYDNLLFVDADMRFSKGNLNRIAAFYSSNTDFIASPKFMPYDGGYLDKIFAVLGNLYLRLNRFTSPVVCGMCVITTKNVFNSINGFDESLRYAEDIDFGLRVFKKGFGYHILPSIVMLSSTRRLQTISRLRLGMLWLKWHIGAVLFGTKRLHDNPMYPYGNYKDKQF